MATLAGIINFDDAVKAVKTDNMDLDSASAHLLSHLTLEERLWLLDGDVPFWPGLYDMMTHGFCHTPCIMGEIPRLNIPGTRFCDGPRGCILGKSTVFPAAMARGASWDVALEERVGRAIGRESKAQGANLFGGICVNIPRHPAWGRVQETYAEDPILLGKMGAATMRGVQENVMACVKHFALNSMENARFKVDVKVDEDVLHEVYLPHFRHLVEQGVSTVMSAYNSVRGEWAGHSKELLTDILRDQWGFKGFVVEDFLFGFRDVVLSLKNGLDLEAPFRQQRAQHLEGELKAGTVEQRDVDRAARVILRTLIANEVKRGDSKPTMDVVFCQEHRHLARESAVKSMVLLKNDSIEGRPVLPLPSNIPKLAVLGWLADSTNTGDKGSSAVRCPEVITAYQGIRSALPGTEVILGDSNDMVEASRIAAAADVVVLVVGYDFRDEGEYTAPAFNATPGLKHVIPPSDGSPETNTIINRLVNPVARKSDQGKDNYGFGAGGDRRHMRLRPDDVELIKTVSTANPATVVCIVSGGAVIIEEWKEFPAAILYKWYSGCEGGNALADLLVGKENFAGRLPFSVPTTESHLPHFDNDAESIEYDRWFGQNLLDRLGVAAAYPFGFGLSYTTFATAYLEVEISELNEELKVSLLVVNAGDVAGRFIAQVYGVVEAADWPTRNLLGFSTIDLNGREKKRVCFPVSTRPLKRWKRESWELVSRSVTIEVSGYAGDESSVRLAVDLGP
ncbi:unnamed protein product [Clonostachys byssicola]|uniref:beta-glucosidase n=1 Tax=Clonostachys byssicola TaxID=160290 RepID=A0A9N9Y868_9HYPO|nr:unnamed protein product [Clonostachys byssicola]